MRISRIIILLMIPLVSCKTASSISQSKYEEDVSIHRPKIQTYDNSDTTIEGNVILQKYIQLEGHIKNELDNIIKISIENNKKGRYVDGYIVQIYSGKNRERANTTKEIMLEKFKDLQTDISYYQPNFRVHSGQFIDRLEATRTYEEIKWFFPKALLIPKRFLLKYE